MTNYFSNVHCLETWPNFHIAMRGHNSKILLLIFSIKILFLFILIVYDLSFGECCKRGRKCYYLVKKMLGNYWVLLEYYKCVFLLSHNYGLWVLLIKFIMRPTNHARGDAFIVLPEYSIISQKCSSFLIPVQREFS